MGLLPYIWNRSAQDRNLWLRYAQGSLLDSSELVLPAGEWLLEPSPGVDLMAWGKGGVPATWARVGLADVLILD